jgi:linoleoyl-CoA desaturase
MVTATPTNTPKDVISDGDWPRPKFPKDNSGFFADLKKRVNQYFTETKKSERDCWQMYLKSAIIMAWMAASYVGLVFFAETWWQAVPLCFSLAAAMATIGMSIQHDGGHHGYSKYNWVNKIAALSMDFIGASSYLWHRKHAVFHHTYVNILDQDTDINAGPLGRFSPHQPRYKIHRFQQIYIWALYGLMAPRWHLIDDYKELMSGKIGKHRIARPKGWDLFNFFAGKVVSTTYLIVIPLMMHEWWVMLMYYCLTMWLLGFILAVVFQLAHVVEEADFPTTHGEPAMVESTWAIHQIETTVDFARTSKSLTWMLGGLNFQVVHHLFPRISHIHYPALSKILEKTCADYNIKYHVHPTFWDGLKSHYRWLKRMGEPVRA